MLADGAYFGGLWQLADLCPSDQVRKAVLDKLEQGLGDVVQLWASDDDVPHRGGAVERLLPTVAGLELAGALRALVTKMGKKKDLGARRAFLGALLERL